MLCDNAALSMYHIQIDLIDMRHLPHDGFKWSKFTFAFPFAKSQLRR